MQIKDVKHAIIGCNKNSFTVHMVRNQNVKELLKFYEFFYSALCPYVPSWTERVLRTNNSGKSRWVCHLWRHCHHVSD